MPENECITLWKAVLARAIKDLLHKNALIRTSAINWFRQNKDTHIGCFVWVCQILDYDPNKLRETVLGN